MRWWWWLGGPLTIACLNINIKMTTPNLQTLYICNMYTVPLSVHCLYFKCILFLLLSVRDTTLIFHFTVVHLLLLCYANSAIFQLYHGQNKTKDYEISICCFSAKDATLRRKSKDWVALNQYNVSKWDDNLTLSINWCTEANGPKELYIYILL
jgi:hypothetical protein